jgi:predicted site-specific integrase-resolvase
MEKSLSSVSVDGVTTSHKTRLVVGGVEYAQIILAAQDHEIRATYS